jgi:ankyrin repeat protein
MNPAWERAAKSGDLEEIRLFLSRGDINARDRYGQAALMIAAHHGHRALVDLLIQYGADLDVAATTHVARP